MSKRALPVIGAVGDMGHSLLKAATRAESGSWMHQVAPHAIETMPRRQWLMVVEKSERQANAVDYLSINDSAFYCIGETAERRGKGLRRHGADRYTDDYILPQMLGMLARSMPVSDAEVVLMALYPPSDARYLDQMRRALTGSWEVLLGNGDQMFMTIQDVYSLDEPVAGFMNVAISDSGWENRRMTQNEVLVLDIGGGTTNVAPVLPGGSVDYGRASSYPMGILEVISRMEELLRDNYHQMLLRARELPIDRLRTALATYQFKGGGRTINVREEAQLAKAALLQQIHQMYYNGAIGGPFRYDTIVLTGGGAQAMGDDLVEVLDHKRICYAADPEEMHLANLQGAIKLFKVLHDLGDIRL